MAETALNIAYEHPLWGVGIGNYRRFSVNYYNRDDTGIAREIIVWKNPHNEFLLHCQPVVLSALLRYCCYFIGHLCSSTVIEKTRGMVISFLL